MSSSKSELEKYKKYIQKQLSDLTPILVKISLGDFSTKMKIPQKENEFTGLLVALNLTIEELRAAKAREKRSDKARRAAELSRIKTLTKAKRELEDKVRERTKELQGKVEELEKFNKIAVGRELKMVALKKKLEEFKKS